MALLNDDIPYTRAAKLVRLWNTRKARSDELRNVHMTTWRAAWAWYRNQVKPITDSAGWWRSNEYIPTPFKIIETILPRYLLAMFEQPDWFSVEGRNQRSEPYENLCENLLRTKLDQMRVFPKVYDAIKYCTIMGHVWGKVVHDETWMRRKTLDMQETIDPMTGQPTQAVVETVADEQVYVGPKFEWLPVDKVWPDPSGRERWYIEQIDTTLEELEETDSYLHIYDKAQMQLLRDSLNIGGSDFNDDIISSSRMGTDRGVGLGVTNDTDPQIPEMEGISWDTVAPQRDGTGITLWQCWGWVPPEYRGPDKCEWVLHVIANGQFLLRDIPANTPDSKPPYFAVRSIRIPGRLYGETILTYTGPLADQQSRLANMRLDEVFLGIWQSMLMRKGALASDNQAYFKPGGYLELNVEPTQSINDVFAIVPRRPLLPDVWTEDQYRQTQQEHVAAASDIMQGVGGSDRQTATEVERRLQQGNARHVLQTMLFGYDFQKELLERTWEWLRYRMTKKESVKLGEEYVEVDWRNIQAPIDIVVGGGFFALSKGTRIQMDQELIGLLQNEMFAQVAKPLPIFAKFLKDRGWKNVERYMLSEDEYAQQQKQQQIMQILESLGGAEGAQAESMDEGAGGETGQMAPDEAQMPDMSGMEATAGMAGQPLSGFELPGNPYEQGSI